MKKAFLYVITVIIGIFICNYNVSAQTYSCEYMYNNDRIKIEFDENGELKKTQKPLINWSRLNDVKGTLSEKEFTSFYGYTHISNWKTCPKYLLASASEYYMFDNDTKVDTAKKVLTNTTTYHIDVSKSSSNIIIKNHDANVANICSSYKTKSLCEAGTFCVWVNNACTVSNKMLGYVSCGELNNIPKTLPKITKLAFDVIKIAVPIMLVIKGSIDLIKASASQKEDEIKKGRDSLVKKLIAAALVFLIVLIMQMVVRMIGTSKETQTVNSCINCFMNNKCNANF